MNSDERKQQLREAQHRRREKLSSGERGQVNIFLSQQCKELVDRWCLEFKTDRHNLINGLIMAFSKDPKNIF